MGLCALRIIWLKSWKSWWEQTLICSRQIFFWKRMEMKSCYLSSILSRTFPFRSSGTNALNIKSRVRDEKIYQTQLKKQKMAKEKTSGSSWFPLLFELKIKTWKHDNCARIHLREAFRVENFFPLLFSLFFAFIYRDSNTMASNISIAGGKWKCGNYHMRAKQVGKQTKYQFKSHESDWFSTLIQHGVLILS